MEKHLSTLQKAFAINLEKEIYGSFAEIGAGQEVARFFFQAGGASGTVAKTMSAYDMAFSDAIYGKTECGRYVTRERVIKMLQKEYQHLQNRLANGPSKKSKYFVFANTVTAKSYSRNRGEYHGWMGILFQRNPNEAPSDIIIHLRMLDTNNQQQQEALGILGVNLIYAAFFGAKMQSDLVPSLMDSLSTKRMNVDSIQVGGPSFADVQEHHLNLQLVLKSMTKAILFGPDGRVYDPATELYDRPLLVLRGSFRPPTKVHFEMMNSGQKAFSELPDTEKEKILVLPEISVNHFFERGQACEYPMMLESETVNDRGEQEQDFLDRINLMVQMGHYVLVSKYSSYYPLRRFLARFTHKRVGFVMGVYKFRDIFNPSYYEQLDGGILQALGTLFKKTTVFVYPRKTQKDNIGDEGKVERLKDLALEGPLAFLLEYFLKKGQIKELREESPETLAINFKNVLEKVKKGEGDWERDVPEEVVKIIKKKSLFKGFSQ